MVETKIVPSQPALILEGKKRSLVVSDLHIGFESNLVTNKIFIGKNTTTQETINEIEDIIDFVKADTLILLGDVKSSIKSITKSEWEDVPKFFKKINDKVDIILIPGNLDATHKKYYKKSSSPILERIKMFSSARIVTLDGIIIGDESIINQIL